MSSIIEYHVKSYVAAEAIGAHIRVKKSGILDTIVIAGAGEASIGVTIANVASGDPVTVRLFNSFGSAFLKASAAIAKNALVYPTAAGKIDDAGTGAPLGYAEDAATADNDVIEVLLLGQIPVATAASAAQAIPTDLATSIAWITNVRLALIADGTIKGAA